MQIPLQISFHGIAHSDALYDSIREKAGKLERYYDRIVSCRVVLELIGRHRREGKQYAVRIDLKVPLRDAFDAAGRRIEDYARIQRGD